MTIPSIARMPHSHARRLRNFSGDYIGVLEPGSPEWAVRMSASKVAAVVGLSPWMSPFTLWHQMAGNVSGPSENQAMARGTYLESAVARWFADQHPGWKIIPTATWQHPEIAWAVATPDRLALIPRQDARLVEIKTAAYADEWGAAGTDEIPAGYRTQVMWSMFVTGASTTHVAVLLPFLELREYIIEYDDDEALFLFEQCARFMDDLERGEPPSLDGSDSTYRTIRELHPDIDAGMTADIDPEQAAAWLRAKGWLAKAADEEQECRARVVDAMGAAQYAAVNGQRLGSRISKNGNAPYFAPARSLPTVEQATTPREDTAA